MADTASLVVALSAQLTKFEKDMRDAGIMAERATKDIEDKFSKINPQINASFLGNLFSNLVTQGLAAAEKAIGGLIDRFVDLQKQATLTGLSMEKVFAFQEAAGKSGAPIAAATEGLKNLQLQLAQMQSGKGSNLSQLLDINPQALEGLNRNLLTTADLVRVVGNLFRDVQDPILRLDLARLLNQSESLIPFWTQGGDKVAKIVAEFERAAPPLGQIVEQSKIVNELWKSSADAITQWAAADTLQFVRNTLGEIAGVLKFIDSLSSPWGGKLIDPKSIRDAATAVDQFKSKLSTQAPFDPMNPGGYPSSGSPFGGRKSGGTNLNIGGGGGGGGRQVDFYAQQNAQIEKHIELMNAEAKAVGQGIFEQERARTETLLNIAANKQYGEVSAEVAQQIKQQADAAGAAALKLAEQRDALAKINQASQIVGSAISTAFADAIIEGKKLDEVLKSLVNTLLKAALNATIMSIFTPGAGGGVSPFASLFKAGGGAVEAGHPYIVGEKGPELMVPGASGQIVPNNVLRQQGGGSIAAPMVFQIDNRGASVEAVARMGAVLMDLQASLPSTVVRTIQTARRNRIPGV